jgi:hypothetical protein
LFGFHAWNHFSFERLTAVSLNVQNFATIANFGKGDGQTIATGTACTTNAVCVVFGFHRQTKVEHVRDGGHVNAAGCYIGGDQNLNLTVAQSHQAAIAQTLAQGAVQSDGIKAILLQVSSQSIALNLGAGKHNGLVDGGITQPMVKQLAFVLRVVGPEQNLFDIAVLFLG